MIQDPERKLKGMLEWMMAISSNKWSNSTIFSMVFVLIIDSSFVSLVERSKSDCLLLVS